MPEEIHRAHFLITKTDRMGWGKDLSSAAVHKHERMLYVIINLGRHTINTERAKSEPAFCYSVAADQHFCVGFHSLLSPKDTVVQAGARLF